jgi:isovaleryl-CoA dehydrogenase
MFLMSSSEEFASTALRSIREKAREIAVTVAAPRADEVDRESVWPEHTMRALAQEGLLGLHVPERLGGLGQGLQGLIAATELLAQSCSSSSMCYGMHCVGTAVIAAKSTKEQEIRYLAPIAAGEHITTLALSESGSGGHFYLPQTELRRAEEGFQLFGQKQFVTNAGHADSYVVSCVETNSELSGGEFSCVVAEKHDTGVTISGKWEGFGMRGNSSLAISFDGLSMDATRLLGEPGDQIWYVFEVIAPYFLTAMAGTYLGISQAALDITIEHVKNRSYETLGESTAVRFNLVVLPSSSLPSMVYSEFRVSTI